MYAHCLPVAEAWIKLHRDQRRNFFAYSTDVALLTSIQARILTESPARKHNPIEGLRTLVPADPEWLSKMDGSLPSRILPYMYLGNLNHANNPELLEELGIKRVVSVGEKVNWIGGMNCPTNKFELVAIKNVQDNGVDSLSCEFERCLEVIGECESEVAVKRFEVLTYFRRAREERRYRYARTLSRGSVPLGNDLHCRSHEGIEFEFSKSIVSLIIPDFNQGRGNNS
jgi:hypothetical protein